MNRSFHYWSFFKMAKISTANRLVRPPSSSATASLFISVRTAPQRVDPNH
uniref:Uncharacterized protein n=1 Tax=Arundo donax TaxID=35708 RepID=A0A0A9EJS2_ARUDO